MSRFNVIFVLGGPGCGKGTQCAKISETFGFMHLSAGDLLRKENSDPNSEHHEVISGHMKAGTIVPVKITCMLLKKEMERFLKEENKHSFLIDGFPRNEDNLNGWEEVMKDDVNLQVVFHFDCKADTCVQRCLGRAAGGGGRVDDNEETLKRRLLQFDNECKKVLDYYAKKNLTRIVDANGSPDEVFEAVKQIFAEIGIKKV